MANRSITRRKLIQLTSGAGVSLGLGWNPLAAQSGEIITRPIPSSGEAVPAIGIGTNRYKVGTAEENAGLRATLEAFAEMGGQVVDTAPVYRSSETILGQLMAELDNRDRLFIATKVEKKDRTGSLERMEGSLVKLQTPVLDLVQSHQMNGAENTLPVMHEWQQAGRVRYIGITTSDTDTFPRMLELMNKEALDFFQVNSPAIIGDLDGHAITPLSGCQADRPDLRLSHATTVLCRLNPMIQGIADQVQQRIGNGLHHRFVQFCLFTADLKVNLFLQFLGQLSNRQLQPLKNLGNGDHPDLDEAFPQSRDLAVQLLGGLIKLCHISNQSLSPDHLPGDLTDHGLAQDQLAYHIE